MELAIERAAAIAPIIRVARLAAERAAFVRLNAGYGFSSARRSLAETFFVDSPMRERMGRDHLRPRDTHLAQQTDVEAKLAEALAAEQTNSPLGELGKRFSLSPLAIRVLGFAIANAFDPDFRSLVSALEARSGGLTAQVIAEMLAEDDATEAASLAMSLAIAQVLSPSGPLLGNRLLTAVDQNRSGWSEPLTTAVVLGPLVAASLAGELQIPADLVPLVLKLPSVDTLIANAANELEQGLERGREQIANGAVILLQGPQGSGKRLAAARLVGTVEHANHGQQSRLLAIDVSAATADQLFSALAFAKLSDRIPYLVGFDVAQDDEAASTSSYVSIATTARAIDSFGGSVVLATRETGQPPIRLERPVHVIALPRPTLEIRTQAWSDGLTRVATIATGGNAATSKLLGAADALAARFVIGCGAIAEVLDDASANAAARSESLAIEHLENSVSRRLSMNLGVLGQRISKVAHFDQMVLPEDVIDTLRDLIAMVNGRSQILETWGYQRHLGISRGVSALFSGAPGTGKTMAASVIASELGLELFRIDLSSVVSKWVGETEKNLAKIFDEAQDAHAMLLFDEADSLFAKRTEVKSATDRYANLEVNYVLQRMEQFDGISVLTSNLESGIDPAFMRRLNFRVRFPEPEAEEREILWRKLIPPEAGLGDVDVSELANRFEMSGGHIRNAIVRAAVVATREGRSLSAADLERGAHHEYFELGKVMHSSL